MARLDNIQYKAAKLVTGAFHYTNKDKLNAELGWETITERGNMLSLNFFHKIHLQETRPLIKTIMPKLDWEKQCLTRSKGGYIPFKYKNEKFNNSFFPNTLKLWNSLSKDIQSKDVFEFKISIKQEINPPKYKHFSKGSKLGNTLLTKIRVGRSDLKQHKFTIGLSDSSECFCHSKVESPEHYFLDCFLYLRERQTMIDLIEHYVPNFKRLNKKQKLDIILAGVNPENYELLSTNITLSKEVQNFILSTKRFTAMVIEI